jgi:hypothetical protein
MGADEIALDEVQLLFERIAPTVVETLPFGEQIIVGADDQLRLILPGSFRDHPDAA